MNAYKDAKLADMGNIDESPDSGEAIGFAEALSAWKRHLRLTDRRAPRTVLKYIETVSHFGAHLAGVDLWTWTEMDDEEQQETLRRAPAIYRITDKDAKAWLEEWQLGHEERYGRLPGSNTVKGKACAVRACWSFLDAEEYLFAPDGKALPNPMRRVKVPAIRQGPIRYLNEDEDRAWREVYMSDRERALVFLLRYTGAREEQITRLTWNAVLFDRERIMIPHNKGKDGAREVYLPPILAMELKKWKHEQQSLGHHDSVGPVITNRFGTVLQTAGIAHIVKSVFRKAGIRPSSKWGGTEVSPHWLRRTYATVLINSSSDITYGDVAKQLGNTAAVVEKSYADLLPETTHERLKRAVG